jgi:hypothetical protein
VLLYPQALSPKTLERLAELHRDEAAGQRLREFLVPPAAGADWTRPGVRVDMDDLPTRAAGRTHQAMLAELLQPASADGPAAVVACGNGPPSSHPPPPPHPPPDQVTQPGVPAWNIPGWADPPWLDWVGPISPALAQRVACDADIWRIIVDPATGQPLDVGRTYRLVPYWIRRALYARDRGCRWPGCSVPSQWSDAHHRLPWSEGGETTVEDCILLCRWHHGRVHEGGWTIDLDTNTGQIHVTRPDGTPYLAAHTRTAAWNGPATQAA